MKVLVACEFSGVVRDAFIAQGHEAVSCDLLETEGLGPHYQGDVFDIINDGWDLMIAHPPCTYLAVSGARWWKGLPPGKQEDALSFAMSLGDYPKIERIALENPIGCLSTHWRKPDQIIQPWMFGHGETKATCLWLKGLPLLQPTRVVAGREARIHNMSPGPNRGKERSRTYPGIARAMATQWGSL